MVVQTGESEHLILSFLYWEFILESELFFWPFDFRSEIQSPEGSDYHRQKLHATQNIVCLLACLYRLRADSVCSETLFNGRAQAT